MDKKSIDKMLRKMTEMGYEDSSGFNLTRLGQGTAGTVTELPNVDIYWSYKTPIAFTHGNESFIIKNEWGPTTGRHISAAKHKMPGNAVEISHKELCDKLRQIV